MHQVADAVCLFPRLRETSESLKIPLGKTLKLQERRREMAGKSFTIEKSMKDWIDATTRFQHGRIDRHTEKKRERERETLACMILNDIFIFQSNAFCSVLLDLSDLIFTSKKKKIIRRVVCHIFAAAEATTRLSRKLFSLGGGVLATFLFVVCLK